MPRRWISDRSCAECFVPRQICDPHGWRDFLILRPLDAIRRNQFAYLRATNLARVLWRRLCSAWRRVSVHQANARTNEIPHWRGKGRCTLLRQNRGNTAHAKTLLEFAVDKSDWF